MWIHEFDSSRLIALKTITLFYSKVLWYCKMVYVVSKDGTPLMPTKRHGKVRKWLKSGEAKIISHAPFTIQLLFETGNETQPITLGVDSGYTYIGFSAVTEKEEVFGGELTLLPKMKERLKERASYRRTRRYRLRYRKPGFLKDTKPAKWLAPSIQHKLDSHVKFINRAKSILPVSKVVVEVANFDTQKIKKPDIEGKEYQEGEQKGFSDLREYILHRDQHKCQNPNCKDKDKENHKPILEVHHLGYWKKDRTNRPSNLITLCTRCHTSNNHQKSGFLYGWEPKLNTFRAATFMSMVRFRLVNQLHCEHTYGSLTKFKRRKLELEKSHHNDAFVIADGEHQPRCNPTQFIQKRKNNRSLEKFYDAQYIDSRDGKKKSGKELCSQRKKRSRENLPKSLRKCRAHKVSSGRRSIRKQRYSIQPQDIVEYQGKQYKAVGTQNHGSFLKMTNGVDKPIVKSMKKIKTIFHQKTLICT